tara:strand:+ start:447 stop:1100 length:654 start_codon:yes stop_codon:yes gene_type:complete
MASNEHKNLSNANLHVPVDFSTASNSTVLTKNSVGDLDWAAVGTVKTHTIVVRGYSTPGGAPGVNYFYRTDVNADYPNGFTEDYGSPDVLVGFPITVSAMLRGASFVAPADCTISNVKGWVSGTVTESVSITLLKGSNTTVNTSDPFTIGAATNTLVILDEFTASTYASNDKLGLIDDESFVVNSLSQGDFLIPIVKSAGGLNQTFFNFSIEIRYNI